MSAVDGVIHSYHEAKDWWLAHATADLAADTRVESHPHGFYIVYRGVKLVSYEADDNVYIAGAHFVFQHRMGVQRLNAYGPSGWKFSRAGTDILAEHQNGSIVRLRYHDWTNLCL